MLRDILLETDADDFWRGDARILVLAAPGFDLSDLTDRVGGRLGLALSRMLADREIQPAPARPVGLDVDHPDWHRVVWLNLGDTDPETCRAAGAALAGAVTADAVLVPAASHADLAALAEGWWLAGYTFTLRPEDDVAGDAGSLTLLDDGDLSEWLGEALTVASAVATARDLANTPSNIKSPQWLADQVVALAEDTGLDVSVLGPDALHRKGFGGMLAVGGGSAHPPRLVVMLRRGARGAPTVVLVGKGITFDSGGLSLKPPDAMMTMKTDMSGAAAVAGAMLALAADAGENADTTIIGLLPLAENMPSGTAYRPGDVITHVGGDTSEVSNTDAEGRLVLADTLAYARQRWQPDVLVDVATLTGAATLGLSRSYGALFTADDGLAEEFELAGEESGDRVWRLPLAAEYRAALESTVADIAQTPQDPTVRAGAITAALFLQHFADDTPWVHLDIAGPARADKARGEVTAGGTGFGVRLLTSWLRAFPVADADLEDDD